MSLFIPLTFGIYWKRSSRAGALPFMVFGMLTWIIFEFYETSWPGLVPATLISMAVMIAGSSIWPKKNRNMIKIELNRLNDAFHFDATNEDGVTVHLDSSPDSGGTNQGMRPMQILLAAMGECSAIDIITILKKQRQEFKDLKITVTGEREKDAIPSLYQSVNAHYKFFGNLDAGKVEKAIRLSIEKYCSVSKTLEKAGAKITYTFEIIDDQNS